MVSAARIAHEFNLDPVMVFSEIDTVKWMIRSTAYGIIASDLAKQQKKK